jgi:ubiquitin C-terminal hydrolase
VAASPTSEGEWEEVGKKNKTSKIRANVIEDSPIAEIFCSKMRSCLKSRGSKPSITLEVFFCIPLDISYPRIRALEDALQIFILPESLDWEVRTFKEYKFETLPFVLCFQLKRFTFSGSGTTKIEKHISFPFQLELPTNALSTALTGTRPVYSLFSVVSHEGESATVGHYTCDIRRSGEWFEYNDTEIRRISARTVSSRIAYLLFYLREPQRTKQTQSNNNK